jgi:hypothetical protein
MVKREGGRVGSQKWGGGGEEGGREGGGRPGITKDASRVVPNTA